MTGFEFMGPVPQPMGLVPQLMGQVPEYSIIWDQNQFEEL